MAAPFSGWCSVTCICLLALSAKNGVVQILLVGCVLLTTLMPLAMTLKMVLVEI